MATAIGIDIGGTFIDIVVADGGRLGAIKVPSTPSSPSDGVITALGDLIGAGRIDPQTVGRLAHGTTVATNAILQGTWAKTALITTGGFRDVLEIGRQDRPHLYDLFQVRPRPVVPRDLRFGVSERIDAEGEVIVPLDRSAVEGLIPILAQNRVEAVAVSFLFSYLNPEHEREAARILASRLDAPIVLSSDVLPEFREYERTSTTVLSAALRPILSGYLEALEAGAGRLGFERSWQIMQSGGTVTSASLAASVPARIALSGPAAGVKGAEAIGRLIGERNLITMDMGGTSCDVSLIRDGRTETTKGGEVGGYPLAVPMIDVHTIGAGGGSIAWIDGGGALRVGPESAGADPGPACYGRGGTEPTVTDAHLVLGRIVPDRSLGGLPPLDRRAAREAVGRLAGRLGLTVEETALGIIEVADAAMERAIRVISVERGHDPRGFVLLPFGGAGPLHGVGIARRLGIGRVVVPPLAGILSAFGLLASEVGHDYSRSIVRPLDDVRSDLVREILAELCEKGVRDLESEGIGPERVRLSLSADMRYAGQSHELNVPFPPGTDPERIDGRALSSIAPAFHAAHQAAFGHAASGEEVELVTLRVRASGPAEPIDLRWEPGRSSSPIGRVPVWFDRDRPTPTDVRSRGGLAPDERIVGPLILVGEDSTLLVPPGTNGRCDRYGNVILEVD